MITLRPAAERGHTEMDWLDSRHTFSFDCYYDPDHVSFRSLRVINEDRVAPGAGFPTHPHRDMEILTYVLQGALEHRDSMNNGSIIQPGEIQRMSAGTGITHSEYNPSRTEPVHLLQIWILPREKGITPGYEQRAFPDLGSGLRRLASATGAGGAVRIHQDAELFAARLEAGDEVRYELASGRHAWVQVARGEVQVNGANLKAGDGAALSRELAVHIAAAAGSEVLLFDLA
jgi:hypothetical protein